MRAMIGLNLDEVLWTFLFELGRMLSAVGIRLVAEVSRSRTKPIVWHG